MPYRVRVGDKQNNRNWEEYKFDVDDSGTPLTSFDQCYRFVSRTLQEHAILYPEKAGEILLIQKVKK